MFLFNVGDGYSEAIVRGYKMGLITSNQYSNLTQCETLEGKYFYCKCDFYLVDFRNQLSATDYFEVLNGSAEKLTATYLNKKLQSKFVKEFKYLRSVASPELAKFMDYISYGYMIDNVVVLIAGALRSFDGGDDLDSEELLGRCHPLGMFDTLPALMVATSVDEIYNTVLCESPLAPYFKGCFSADDLDEVHIELIRNHLWKAYLEDFNFHCQTSATINESTRELMKTILDFEADRRVINIAVNSCGSERLSKQERVRLFPRFGTLWNSGISQKLANVDDLDQIRGLLDPIPAFRGLLNDYLSGGKPLEKASSTTSYELPRAGAPVANNTTTTNNFSSEPRSLEEHFFEREVKLCKEAFEFQCTFAVFYAWCRLKEQEIRNLIWIAECISQGQRQNAQNFIPIF